MNTSSVLGKMALFTFVRCTPYIGYIHFLPIVLIFWREHFALDCGSQVFLCFYVLDYNVVVLITVLAFV